MCGPEHDVRIEYCPAQWGWNLLVDGLLRESYNLMPCDVDEVRREAYRVRDRFGGRRSFGICTNHAYLLDEVSLGRVRKFLLMLSRQEAKAA